MKIVFATGNQGKVREIREIMGSDAEAVYTMKEAGLTAEPEENGSTFLENAVIKAAAVAALAHASEEYADAIVMADDSGLVIDALNGEPGIYSARYMGHETSYREKNANLISRLAQVEKKDRTARFVCAIAAVCPDGTILKTEGVMEGWIGYREAGNGGFGYDPIFYLPGTETSSAEITSEEKNAISHRGKALRAMKELLVQA